MTPDGKPYGPVTARLLASLPAGWTLTVSDERSEYTGTFQSDRLTAPWGESWALIGNKTEQQRAEMVRVMLEARGAELTPGGQLRLM